MRIDIYLTENNYFDTRTKAQSAIEQQRVIIDGKIISKSSFDFDGNGNIVIVPSQTDIFVSRGGMKLQKAIEYFNVDIKDKICVDIGASTGGFTHCLLNNGAKKVYAVDSGSNQLNEKIKNNSRVVSLENTNARYIDMQTVNNEGVEVAVIDVSFVSQTLFHKAIYDILQQGGVFISLVKPQFEAGRQNIGKNGIVKNQKVRNECIERVKQSAESTGFCFVGSCESPITGGSGNIEYLCCFTK